MMIHSETLSERALGQIGRPVNVAWLAQVFSSRAAETGGIVRRKRRDVHREVGRDAFFAEVQHRGFHLLECGDQYIVICHSGHMRVIC